MSDNEKGGSRGPIDRPDVQPRGAKPSDDPEFLRLYAEDLAIGRERVETGRVHVHKETREHEELVSVALTEEHVEVERIAINRPIEVIPKIRQEGDTTIVPVVEEILVVQRQLVLKEEVHIRLVRTTKQHEEHVVLRRQEAVISRIPAEPSETDPKGE